MRDLATSSNRLGFLRFGFAVAALAFLAFGRPAMAANPAELNFGLFGPSYDGRVAECERALGTITSQFQEKESTFWNSRLQIVAYGNIHEIAFRPWQSDNIPRRYCAGTVQLNDGTFHALTYSIIEDGGFAGFGQGLNGAWPGSTAIGPITPPARPPGPSLSSGRG